MSDDRWRDSYDSWNLRSLDDDYDDEPGDDCDHSEYTVDLDGRATCDYCPHSWNLSGDEFKAYLAAEARWAADYDRMIRRENSLFWRAVDWLRSMMPRLPSRRRQQPITDDDIPF